MDRLKEKKMILLFVLWKVSAIFSIKELGGGESFNAHRIKFRSDGHNNVSCVYS